MNPKRARQLNRAIYSKGPIIYWMSRAQRAHDNWALLHAARLAADNKTAFAVVFNLTPDFPGATWRHYHFMLEGLKETAEELHRRSIPFYITCGNPQKTIPEFCQKYSAGALVADFSPLHIYKNWHSYISKKIRIPFIEVDAHNIIPCWIASPKQEFGAYTIRPKIHKLLPEFLDEYPPLPKPKTHWEHPIKPINFNHLIKTLKTDLSVTPSSQYLPGPKAAIKTLKNFLNNNLSEYDQIHNDPTQNGQSELSPYLHFGQISAQRIALETIIFAEAHNLKNAQDIFLEELIVRRELADNYCHYNPAYDNFKGFPNWAQKSLNGHRMDPRDYLYTTTQFENAQTHDPLWNAAQRQMVITGKMHNYLRMYWAKKILEWSPSPEQAQKTAIYLNDKYELDGRDPNGYTGIAWSIGGLHDRPWSSRPIFGQIRYMNYQGCKKKFDIAAFIEKFPSS